MTPAITPELRERAGKDRHPDKLSMVCCPFCGEDGFDLYGLKTHFNMGWCEPFDAISEADRLDAPPASPLATGEAA